MGAKIMSDSNLRPIALSPTWWKTPDAPFGTQELRNLYAVALPDTEKNPFGLLELPRLKAWSTVGSGPIRMISSRSASAVYVVSGSEVYSVSDTGTATKLGDLPSAVAPRCPFGFSGSKLAFVSDGRGYLIDGDTLTEAASDGNIYTNVTSVAFLKRRWIWTKSDTTSFYFSELDDPLNVPNVNITSAEGDPDNIVSVFTSGSDAFILGTNSVEIFRTTSDPTAPYQAAGQTPQSCGSGDSVVRMAGDLIWVDSQGIVQRAAGYQGTPISDPAVNRAISRGANLSSLAASGMTWRGVNFYVLDVPGVSTYVYNLRTGLWSERSSFGRVNFRGGVTFSFGSTYLVGDSATGAIWQLTSDPVDDAGDPFERTFTVPELHDGASYFSLNELMIEGKMGQSALGETAQIACDVSKDEGKTFGQRRYADLGSRGEYNARARFRQFGQARSFVPRFRITDAVSFEVTGAFADVD